jgi:hypothetical protein
MTSVVPSGGSASVNAGAIPPISTDRVGDVTVPPLLVADTVNVEFPGVVGVPASTPFVPKVSPGGSDPVATENVGVGCPLALNVYA